MLAAEIRKDHVPIPGNVPKPQNRGRASRAVVGLHSTRAGPGALEDRQDSPGEDPTAKVAGGRILKQLLHQNSEAQFVNSEPH